jgi:hypothetical protein
VLVKEWPTVCGERWQDCRPRPSTPTPSTSDTRDSGTTYSGRPPYDFRLAVGPNPLGAGAVFRRGHNRLTARRTSERNSALDTRGCCIPCYMIEPTPTDLAAGPLYVTMPRDWTSSRASVRRHRSAQRLRWLLRSIRPKRANRPSDASVNPTKERKALFFR